VDRYRPGAEEPPRAAAEEPDQLALFSVEQVSAPELPQLEPIPAPPLHRVRRLSYSALALYERCSYRFYAERVAGMRPVDARVAALPGAAAERPFAFEHDGVLLHGRLDVLHLADGSALVVDFKTNVLEERVPAEIVESDYALQRLVYALACFRAGAKQVEVV